MIKMTTRKVITMNMNNEGTERNDNKEEEGGMKYEKGRKG